MVCAVAAGFFLLRFDIDVAMMSQMSTNRIHAPATLVEIHHIILLTHPAKLFNLAP